MICDRCGSEKPLHGKHLCEVHTETRHIEMSEPVPLEPQHIRTEPEYWEVWHEGLKSWVLSEATTQFRAEEHARALRAKNGGLAWTRKLVPGAPIHVEGAHTHAWHNNLGRWFCVDCGEIR